MKCPRDIERKDFEYLMGQAKVAGWKLLRTRSNLYWRHFHFLITKPYGFGLNKKVKGDEHIIPVVRKFNK